MRRSRPFARSRRWPMTPMISRCGSINCGRAMMIRGDVEAAEEWLTRALAQAEKSGIKKLAGECHNELVRLFKQKGDAARALYHFEEYHRIDTDLRRTDLTRRVARMEMQVKVEQVRMETVERSRQELERLVEQRTRELQEAKNHAELANRSKSDFLAHMTTSCGRRSMPLSDLPNSS